MNPDPSPWSSPQSGLPPPGLPHSAPPHFGLPPPGSPHSGPPHSGPPEPLGEPEPPPGPGVTPPFAAPPADRNSKGLWIGLGVGALVLVLCCVGGVAGVGYLVLQTSSRLESSARALVTAYLGALRDEQYPRAYELLCARTRRAESAQSFATRQSRERVESFTVLGVRAAGSGFQVAATVIYPGTGERSRQYLVENEPSTTGGAGEIALAVCGER